jgi:transposase
MPRPYSGDLRVRVIEDISTGAPRREAAERYGISASVAVLWAQRFEKTGSVAAKPSGGSTSPLEDHAGFLLGLISERSDLTLDEIVAAMRKEGIPGSRSAVWRFFERRNISFKKNGSSWNRVGDFWVENARRAGIARRFCILRAAILA